MCGLGCTSPSCLRVARPRRAGPTPTGSPSLVPALSGTGRMGNPMTTVAPRRTSPASSARRARGGGGLTCRVVTRRASACASRGQRCPTATTPRPGPGRFLRESVERLGQRQRALSRRGSARHPREPNTGRAARSRTLRRASDIATPRVGPFQPPRTRPSRTLSVPYGILSGPTGRPRGSGSFRRRAWPWAMVGIDGSRRDRARTATGPPESPTTMTASTSGALQSIWLSRVTPCTSGTTSRVMRRSPASASRRPAASRPTVRALTVGNNSHRSWKLKSWLTARPAEPT
mmetsp:Transcript_11853/g.27553  ORF Transcript_11853/g.27553 Transcript_11853/m.27553 type:complete len:289 (-) Transcript_11853:224-1090(-)